MSNIKIYETDITARRAEYNPTKNIVYIPGFTCGYVKSKDGIDVATGASGDTPSETYFEKNIENVYTGTLDVKTLAGKIYYKKIDSSLYNEITLCESLSDFQDKYGVTPYKFIDKQDNPTKTVVGSESPIDTHKVNINAGNYDKSYIIAAELLKLGCSVLYDAFPAVVDSSSDKGTVKNLYANLTAELEKLEDLNTYNVKIVTTGAYESLGELINGEINTDLVKPLLELSCRRNDSLSLVDYNNSSESFNTPEKLKSIINKLPNMLVVTDGLSHLEDARDYGALFTSDCLFDVSDLFGNELGSRTFRLPASAAYLISFAKSAQTKPNFYAIAGVTRGAIPFLAEGSNPSILVNGLQAEALTSDEGIAVNPITRINPYGYCIWGNRTLHNNIYKDEYGKPQLVASSFLNIRLLTCDIKKILRNVALKLNFEIKSDILWLNFKSQVEPEFDKIIANYGIEKYKLTQVNTNERGKIKIKLTVWCLYAVEKWDIEVELTDSYISIK